MDAFLDSLQGYLDQAVDFVWGPFLLIPLLLLTGLYLTIRLRGLQFRVLGHALWLAVIRRKESAKDATGDVSHYQALATALAATIGVGNIAGVATAIGIGGPGALFWMWMTGLVGMATKYSEALLGVKYRDTDAAGEKSGGPMYYLYRGIRGVWGKILGFAFAIFGAIAAFGIGNMVQSNTAAGSMEDAFGIDTQISGIVLAVVAGVVILGGIKSIARVASGIVPIMMILYVLLNLIVLVIFADQLPSAIALVFTEAFTGSSAVGGFTGAAIILVIQMGVARGIFSNESGLGTGAIAAAAAITGKPVRQAMVSMTQTFLDTIIMVTLTAFMLIVTGAYYQEGLEGAVMTAWAAEQGIGGGIGTIGVALAVLVFAFTTLLGWAYFGERCIVFLVGRRGVVPYRIVFVLFVYVGAVVTLDLVFAFSDVANGLMALPNLIGLIVLSGVIVRETRKYFADEDWRDVDAVDARQAAVGAPGTDPDIVRDRDPDDDPGVPADR